MKTKQEILTGGSRIVSNTGLWKGKRILEAMEEYAQQEAMEFAKWKENNFEEVKPPNQLPADYMARRIEVYGDDTYIIEELYKIWKDERAKNM